MKESVHDSVECVVNDWIRSFSKNNTSGQLAKISSAYATSVNCAELKQFDFRRGAAEARSVKLRFAPAQEGCSKACLDREVD